jgi:hypothetical protein
MEAGEHGAIRDRDLSNGKQALPISFLYFLKRRMKALIKSLRKVTAKGYVLLIIIFLSLWPIPGRCGMVPWFWTFKFVPCLSSFELQTTRF